MAILVFSGVWPVSYTHLDVYKRQDKMYFVYQRMLLFIFQVPQKIQTYINYCPCLAVFIINIIGTIVYASKIKY